MKNLRRMIEVARRKGIFFRDNYAEKGDQKIATTEFFELIEKCQPFVFMNPNNPDGPKLPAEEVDMDKYPKIDVPFELFSIEMLNGPITSPRPGDETDVYIDCIVNREFAPEKHGQYVLVRQFLKQFGTPETEIVFLTNTMRPTVKRYLDRLQVEKDGLQKIKERVKLGSGQTKRIHTFRKLVYVCPKKLITKSLGGTRNIDWSHRWSVRGHWRGITGIGKDREGNYCVQDNTWVNHYTKGPEDKPLIKKVRIVKDETGDNS